MTTNPTTGAAASGTKIAEAIVDNEKLRRLYEVVLTCRTAGEKGRGTPAGATAYAAATIELTGDDAVATVHDSVTLALVRGAAVPAAETKDHATVESNAPKLIERAGAGGSQLSVAAGVALAYKLEAKPAVVVALTDATWMSSGAAYEALNYASANKLGMIIVVENMKSGEGPVAPEFTAIAQAHGVPAFVVDGEDAVAVYRVAREAINRARGGRGPSLIECRAFESSEAPLRHLERYLEKHGLWTPEWKRELLARIEGELRQRGAA